MSKKFDRERALADAYYEVVGERDVHDVEYDQFVGAWQHPFAEVCSP